MTCIARDSCWYKPDDETIEERIKGAFGGENKEHLNVPETKLVVEGYPWNLRYLLIINSFREKKRYSACWCLEV